MQPITLPFPIPEVFQILLLTILIYCALYYLRGARGSYVLAGIIIILVICGMLSHWLNLAVITWMLDNFLISVATAIIIIFQPELRRALAQLGSYTFWQGRKRREVISELVSATEYMAKRKCGALIVLERRIGMQNIIDDAVRLDIKINSMIIESIFFPNSPLHDGAIIVRDDRIVAARAILPLTRSNTVSQRLGTRHRAGLGISEETDAVIIVVSEETGTISIAYRGALYRDLTANVLENYLEKLIMQQSDEELEEAVQLVEMQSEQPQHAEPETEKL